MAFASSSSAFGIQPPAATTRSNTFGGFGSTVNPSPANPSSNLFGGSTAAQTTNAGTNIFGAPQPAQQQQQQQPQQNPSPFGSFAQQQTQQQPQQQQAPGQPSTNLFGQPQAAPSGQAQSAPSNNIFGQGTSQTQQPSLFGQQQPNVGAFGQPSTTTGGSSIFGNTQTQQSQQPSQNIFGQQSTAGFGNTFGGSTTQQPSQNLFGNFGGQSNAQQQQPNTLGGSTAQNQPQQSAPLPFTRSTKFNDLPDELKKTFEQIDSHIQGRIHISNELKSKKLGQEAEKGTELIRSVNQQLGEVANTLKSDAGLTDHLKEKLDESIQDTIAATRIIEGFRNQQTSGVYLKNYAMFPLEYFTKVAEQLKAKLQWYKTTVEQIERKIGSLASRAQYTPQAITTTLQAQHATFISLAKRAAELDGEVERIRTAYRELWRAKTGSARDPFEIGLASLEIR
ncbi:hypothetical protein SISSUDRAFT_673895 [Sistotremastrum suecicum HHB10207 ss-3]|uniref:Nucleoporin Nup54 alpha-helical domain-containing protein n=1 Tax=Sistotremastrum suecicum HHB10207 ss-3 TaxID=1314776 RepID=A0A166E277_9AGAM|nr:hypothetical protein SISSUDRAFT_673895 [Sistotremastrum suecicum HHB10207 ss-3]